jgi:hypothetical protein
MVEAYWDVGRQISEAQNNNSRAEYGTQLLKYLSDNLTADFGKGFDESSFDVCGNFIERSRFV